MIELPEALVIAAQIEETLCGRRIRCALRGNAPHKFAFYSGPPEHYAATLPGKTVGRASAEGGLILVEALPGYLVVLGGGGERILYHPPGTTLPSKHQLLLEFEDGAHLSVTVQGWGSVNLFSTDEPATRRWCGFDKGLMPTDSGFTFPYFDGLFSELGPEDPRSVKYFLISKPGVRGLGNGYLQDILFHSRLHPRTRAADLDPTQRRALYEATRQTITAAIELHGRDDEHDLFDGTGHYHRILSAHTAGSPCPRCRTPIAKESFLGGAVYFCPQCQPVPARRAARRKAARRQG
ncbi:MAG: zinc finger domain-containing protein [Candidatus Latescibacterota bacterium]